jgi:hypothetical protein
MQRQTGGNTSNSVAVAAAAGIVGFIVIVLIMGMLPE